MSASSASRAAQGAASVPGGGRNEQSEVACGAYLQAQSCCVLVSCGRGVGAGPLGGDCAEGQGPMGWRLFA